MLTAADLFKLAETKLLYSRRKELLLPYFNSQIVSKLQKMLDETFNDVVDVELKLLSFETSYYANQSSLLVETDEDKMDAVVIATVFPLFKEVFELLVPLVEEDEFIEKHGYFVVESDKMFARIYTMDQDWYCSVNKSIFAFYVAKIVTFCDFKRTLSLSRRAVKVLKKTLSMV